MSYPFTSLVLTGPNDAILHHCRLRSNMACRAWCCSDHIQDSIFMYHPLWLQVCRTKVTRLYSDHPDHVLQEDNHYADQHYNTTSRNNYDDLYLDSMLDFLCFHRTLVSMVCMLTCNLVNRD
jgi:hypothetical protein